MTATLQSNPVPRPANPILWQENTYHQRSPQTALMRWRMTGPLLYSVIMGGIALSLTQVDYPTRDIAIYVIWIIHAATAIRAIVASANSISREHVGLTWDALVLTGVSAQQILWGKWRAALDRTAPWMLALGATRLLLLPVFVMAILNRFAWRLVVLNNNNPGNYYDPFSDIRWVSWAAMLAVVGAVVLTLLEVMFSSAIGLASSAVTKRGVLSLILALSVRFIPIALFAGFTRYDLGLAPTYRVLRYPLVGLADGGTAPLTQLIVPLMSWTATLHSDAALNLVIPVVALSVLTIVALFVAWVAIRASGALPQKIGIPQG